MKYIKKFEIAKMYDENDIFHYIDNVDNNKIKELIKNIPNINLNIKNKNGDTPLILTIEYSLYEIFKTLIKNDVNVNEANSSDKTPLMLAVRNKYENMIDDLISYNVDINYQNKDGDTALIVCSQYRDQKSLKILKKLITAGADWNIKDDINNTFIDYLPKNFKNEILTEFEDKYELYKNINKFNL